MSMRIHAQIMETVNENTCTNHGVRVFMRDKETERAQERETERQREGERARETAKERARSYLCLRVYTQI